MFVVIFKLQNISSNLNVIEILVFEVKYQSFQSCPTTMVIDNN